MAVDIHPATARLLDNFRYDHLPAGLQEVSKPFHDLAHRLAETLTGPEVMRALGNLWDAKNWAVVAASNAALEGTSPAAAMPEVGDVVLVPADPSANNGAAAAPAIVTRVWSATVINARVLHDGDGGAWRTSLSYREDLAGAEGTAVWTRKARTR